jgi:Tfp pilus assembly protein PilN
VRPVNLIPPEQRRGDRAPMRTGPLAYVVVAVLGVALVGVTLLTIAGNQISEREAEKASLESRVAEAEAAAERLSPFAEFASLQQAREDTVSSLARSRFDWERVLRELAIVIPDDVWLTGLSATASAGVAVEGGSSSSSSGAGAGVEGPSLQIQGCAAGHEAVARFLAALDDVDGVTRVAVMKSDRPDVSSGSSAEVGAATASSGGGDCSDRDFVSTFEAVAAFDAVQADPASPEPTPATPGTDATASADQGEVGGAERELQEGRSSAAEKTQKARNASETFIPGTGTGP